VGLPKVLIKEYSTPKQENKQKHNRITFTMNRFIDNLRFFLFLFKYFATNFMEGTGRYKQWNKKQFTVCKCEWSGNPDVCVKILSFLGPGR
jgi:hypothetical protein